MRVGSFNVQRPSYYDRGSVFASAATSYASLGAGSISSNTDVLTVAAGKLCILTSITVAMQCVTTFTAGDYAMVTLRNKVGGGAAASFSRALWYPSAINQAYTIAIPTGIVLGSGDVLNVLWAGTASGASTITSWVYLSGNTFDA